MADSSSTIEIPGTDLKLESSGHMSSTYLTLGYKNGGVDINHNETSSAAGFFSPNEGNNVSNNMVDVGVTKEFLRSKIFSISLLANTGFGKGKNTIKRTEKANLISDKTQDIYYGGGFSINFNREAFGLKIQPFISTQYQFSNSEYNSSYSKLSDPGTIYNITTTNNEQRLMHTAGIRFFNMNKSLMSYINLDFNQNLINDKKTDAFVGTTSLELEDPTEIDENPIRISVGFGFML